MNYLSILILCLISIPTYAQYDPHKSKILNEKGHAFFQTKKYTLAIPFLERAIERNGKNYDAHYNLACTYAMLTTQDTTCNTIYYAKTVESLKNCILLDKEKTIQKAKSDGSFEGIKNEYEFNVLIYELSFKDANRVKEFIVGKTYQTSTPGSTYYPINTLTLFEDYTWLSSFHENAEEMANYWHFNEDFSKAPPQLKIGHKKGSWQLNDHILTLYDENKIELKQILLENPSEIDKMYYPDPNDMRDDQEIRHYWKCGVCGCQPIKGL